MNFFDAYDTIGTIIALLVIINVALQYGYGIFDPFCKQLHRDEVVLNRALIEALWKQQPIVTGLRIIATLLIGALVTYFTWPAVVTYWIFNRV